MEKQHVMSNVKPNDLKCLGPRQVSPTPSPNARLIADVLKFCDEIWNPILMAQFSMLLCSCCCYRSPGLPGSPPNLHSRYAIMWLLVSIWVLQSLVLFRWTSNGHKSVPRRSSLWCFEVAGVHLENTVASLRILTASRRTRCFATTPARCKSGKCHRLALRIQLKYKTYIPNITKSILQIAAKFSFLTVS